ncbi:hypothetical protein GU926_06570 [Nibribacter ruber]|uniref:Uncharacterized protein n=1 Tax=Nibribacter ruber TaxID=2698458 RepID=A0A6P1NVN1_9BACT|nr:hypothetical protein [Nibribacter ruber]QHL87110.1 hypothetical protein GU926_06570 [Nibribacter ruber]
MKKLILLGGLWLTCAATAFSNDGNDYWERLNRTHPEANLTSILNSKTGSKDKSVAGYRLSVKYDGKFRAISADNLLLLESQGMKKGELRAYKYEILFLSEGQELWLPMKTIMVEQLQLELQKDEPVLLYTTVLENPEQEDFRQVTLLVQDFNPEVN